MQRNFGDASLVQRRNHFHTIEKTSGSGDDGAGETFQNAVVASDSAQPDLFENAPFL